MKVWAYDIETIINCFTVTFMDVEDESNVFTFGVHDKLDHRPQLRRFINEDVKGLVGFNNINFDRKILNYVCDSSDRLSADTVAKTAYEMAQCIISDMPFIESRRYGSAPDLDLYLLYHFNNEARRTSLKWIQCHLNMDSIQEMPHPHDKPVTDWSEINEILKYNKNDVLATRRLYKHKKTTSLLDLRKWAKREYGLPNLNISNAHMGEQIFIREVGEYTAPDISVRTINIGKLILPQIEFKSEAFNRVLRHFKKIHFKSDAEKPKMGIKIPFAGMHYVFGLGGLHAVRPDTIWDNIKSIDVKSFYPNIAIQFDLKPKHMGEKFTKVYRKLYDQRVEAKDPVVNNGLKEALNSVFGKSNSIYSPLYDPDFTFSITINGQLLMAMLAERIEMEQAGMVIMVNTDGMEIKLKDEAKFNQILSDWIKLTRMNVSTGAYSKIMIRDVNNYIAMTFAGDVKTKGAYEVNKDWNKDPSASVCAYAVQRWFVDNIPVEKTIRNVESHHDVNRMQSFHLYKRAKTGKLYALSPDGSTEIELPKTIRYYISDVGYTLYQITDAMKAKVHADGNVTFLNDLTYDPDRSNVDLKWYIREANKMIVEPEKTFF